jgi:hypothetical protein
LKKNEKKEKKKTQNELFRISKRRYEIHSEAKSSTGTTRNRNILQTIQKNSIEIHLFPQTGVFEDMWSYVSLFNHIETKENV